MLGRVSSTQLVVIAGAVTVVAYLLAVVALLLAGRRADAGALARFIPDCVVLFKRLLGDPRVPRRRKLLVGAMLAYLASPLDLVPDFIPVVGQLDDAIVVALVLRSLPRGSGEELLREHWPGPTRSLQLIERASTRGVSPPAS